MGSIMGSFPLQSNEFAGDVSRAERISAALDGEPSSSPGAHAGGQPAHMLAEFLATLDAEGRVLWAEYHVVGDALRSDELAESPAASAAFVARFSARLAGEPHLLAPSAFQANFRRTLSLRRRVLPVFAVAAAAAVVTWVVVPQLRGIGTGASGAAQVASVNNRDGDTMQRVALASTPVNNGTQGSVQGMNIVRDADLDQYLAAHQQFAQQPMVQSATPLIRAAAVSEGK
jgi:sigma-E factor negative regulatory protein RseA